MKALTNEQKYSIADKLAEGYKDVFDTNKLESDKPYRYQVFGVICHTPNSKGIELTDKYSEEDVQHIANLTINKLINPLSRVVVDF